MPAFRPSSGRFRHTNAPKGLTKSHLRQIGSPCRAARLNAPRCCAPMRNEFTAIIEKDSDWFVAYSPEVPGANGSLG